MRLPLHTRLPRTVSITVLLVLALAFAVVLAWQAAGASQHQKMQAERVLRDYSAYAAARFASRSAQATYYSFVPALKSIEHVHGTTGHVPDPAHLPAPSSDQWLAAALIPHIRYTFEFDTVTRRVAYGGKSL